MDDEVEEKQIKNMKRKLVGYIWEATTKRTIELCLILRLPVPKTLINKFASKDFDSES